jgi:hypothetical protein
LFPQALQSFAELLASERAATFVFDFAFPAILITSFHLTVIVQDSTKIPVQIAMHNTSSQCYLYLYGVSRGQPCSIIAGKIIYRKEKILSRYPLV